MVLAAMDWVFLHQVEIKEILSKDQSDGGNAKTETPLDNSELCQVAKANQEITICLSAYLSVIYLNISYLPIVYL